jgi:hypothetical protein
MSRVEKLYERLDSMENEYALLLETEIRKIFEGRFSRYFSRKHWYTTGKYWRDSDSAYLERLEKDIRSLRAKLHLPLRKSNVRFADQIVEQRELRKDWYHGGNKVVARDILNQLHKH